MSVNERSMLKDLVFPLPSQAALDHFTGLLEQESQSLPGQPSPPAPLAQGVLMARSGTFRTLLLEAGAGSSADGTRAAEHPRFKGPMENSENICQYFFY